MLVRTYSEHIRESSLIFQSRQIRSEERLTLETSALKHFTVANFRYQLS